MPRDGASLVRRRERGGKERRVREKEVETLVGSSGKMLERDARSLYLGG
jgi:hypothetical protein